MISIANRGSSCFETLFFLLIKAVDISLNILRLQGIFLFRADTGLFLVSFEEAFLQERS